jgi:MFS family permease
MTNRAPNRVLIPLGVGLALSLLGDQTLYTVLPNPEIAAQAGVTLGMVGILLGINRLTRVVFNIPAGMLYSKRPRRGLMIAAMCIAVLSTMFYAFTRGVELLLIGRVLWGIAWSGIWIGSNTVALDISHKHNRGQITGRLQAWFFLGIGLASFAGGVFTDLFGYRGGLWVSTALTAGGVLLWVLTLPETRPPEMDEEPEVHTGNPKPPFPWKTALQVSVPTFVLRLVFAGVLTATTILWLAQFVDGGISLPGLVLPLATLTGGFVAVRVLVSMLSAPLSGSISDRLGRRWAVMVVVFAVGAGGLWLMSLQIAVIAVIGALMATVSAGSIQSLVAAIIGDQAGVEEPSRVIGVVYTIGDLGSAIGPMFGLMLVPLIGLGSVYQICAVLFGLVGIFAAFLAFREPGIPVT